MAKTDRAGRRPRRPEAKDKLAKNKDVKPAPASDAPEAGANDPPMRRALRLFELGDYVAARPLLKLAAKDATISETQRAFARSILRAMGLDALTVWAGVASIALAVLVVVATSMLQP